MHRLVLVILFALILPIRPVHADGSGVISVTAVGFRGEKGEAVFSLYRRGKSWLSVGGAFRTTKVAIKNGKASVSWKDVPHDQYAVAVVHDENGNGKLDMQYVPYPSPQEGGGVSNNWVRSGKPEYDKARFELTRSLMSVRITMRY
jgi:uncharacterized protein (DUF2141 family)